MTRHIIFIVLMLASTLAGLPLRAQEEKKSDQSPQGMEQFKLGKPGIEHEKLARYSGDWNVEIRMGSGGFRMSYQGKATSRITVGGRFLQIDYQAKGNAGSVEGIFTLGFDARHKRHTLIAMDSFGTYFVTSQGQKDDKAEKIRMLGADDDPMMKAMGFTKEFVHILDLQSADEFAIEVWMVDTRTSARKEFKYIEYLFKRAKPAEQSK